MAEADARREAKWLLRDVLEEARFRVPGAEQGRSVAADLINGLLDAVDRVR